MEKTYEDFFYFKAQAENYIKEKGDTRFSYALKKALKRNEKIKNSHDELSLDIQIDHALIDDKTKKILKDAKGNPEHSKDTLKEAKREIKKLLDKNVKIQQPETWPEIPEDLTIDEIEMFSGFVIDPSREEELIENILRKDDEKREQRRKEKQ